MPPKQQVVGAKKSSESIAVRTMRELLRDYEIRAEKYETSVAGSIRRQMKKALDEDRVVTRATLSGDLEEGFRRKKIKIKQLKEEKPLVKVLPLIESLRARRYTQLQEFYVWDCHVENDDSMALAGMISRGCYPLTRVELIDCFMDAKSVGHLAAATAYSRTLRDLVLDFNDLGERGCRVLCAALTKSRYLVHLSLSFCGLTKQCGLWLGNLVVETAIRELILDGNPLEAEGVIALLSQLSEAAESEGFERAEEIKRKQMAQEEAKRSARPVINLEAPDQEESQAPGDTTATEGNTASQPQGKTTDDEGEKKSHNSGPKKKAKKRGKRGKKGQKNEPPPSGPQISILRLADTGINHMGRGGNFAPYGGISPIINRHSKSVFCPPHYSIISHSKDLQEIDLFANEVGDLGARQILEGILARKDAKLPQIGVRMGHRINQDTFDMIHKLAPGPKKKKGKGKK
ncbi:unnamed protein product [Echinostoma caproni]|uniref:Centrosomal protein 78 n=1 Tax=Echinostoma caproni TaxID=27848 RepID=A0A183ACI9_9TREM|nr:unnamed protein product [Echinostoma caproni]